VDPVIYGRHFDDRVPAGAVGEKLLKRNLSDIAAMGGRPVAAVISVTLDAMVSLKWMEEFYRGLAASARHYGVSIVGGDVAQAPHLLAASLTLVGEASAGRVLTRTGARVGDWIFVTGELGRSLPTGHHHAFIPRLKEGAWLVRRREVRAMIDVSDGLAKDLHPLTPPGATPAIAAERIPRRGDAELRAALTDGEDYELLFAVAARADLPAFERAWKRRFRRTRLTCLGHFVRLDSRPAGTIDFGLYHGYEHLR
jgi:thiamine-monophosphate kinase